jgi:hypothetical protein
MSKIVPFGQLWHEIRHSMKAFSSYHETAQAASRAYRYTLAEITEKLETEGAFARLGIGTVPLQLKQTLVGHAIEAKRARRPTQYFEINKGAVFEILCHTRPPRLQATRLPP